MGAQCGAGELGGRIQCVSSIWDDDKEPLADGVWSIDNWDVQATPMKKNSFGVWEVTVPAKNGAPAIPHDSKIKVN